MNAILSILILISCILLILAVLIQNPKGGGLASGFQSGAQVMGVRRTADFLEKATWGLAVLILLLSITSTSLSSSGSSEGVPETETSATKDKAADFDNKTAPVTAPAAPGATQPAPTNP